MVSLPYIVGIGGTTSVASSTERALELALNFAEAAGARVKLFGGDSLSRLPHYDPKQFAAGAGRELVEAVSHADGIILASPGYHGSISGLVKNAIDFLQETATNPRAYLDGVPVGLIATAHGWHAAVNTVGTLRSIAHALRGWPTPFGAAVNCSGGVFGESGLTDETVRAQLQTVARQVVEFAARGTLTR